MVSDVQHLRYGKYQAMKDGLLVRREFEILMEDDWKQKKNPLNLRREIKCESIHRYCSCRIIVVVIVFLGKGGFEFDDCLVFLVSV